MRRPGALPPGRRLAASPAPIDGPASYPDGVVLRVVEVSHGVTTGTGAGSQPGQDVSSLTLEVVNRSSVPLDLSGVVVAVQSGPDRTPADPVYGDGQQDFAGSLPRGGRARATYAFALRRQDRDEVSVIMDFDGRHAPAVWRGALG